MKTPVWLFQVFKGLPVDAVPVVIPFAAFQEAANSEVYTQQRS
jgi:hypothetical protein